jgi:PIN domain nuclease of toxin-antitoxin system
MDVLLDTHILVWAWTGDERLTPAQKDLLAAKEVRSA